MKTRDAFLIGTIIVIAICVLVWGILMSGSSHAGHKEFTFKEQLVQSKYDIVYPGAHLTFAYYNKESGVYRVIFDSRAEDIDFSKIPEDSLRQTADTIYHDLVPAIPDREEYDSLSVRFHTKYPSKPESERRLSDTAFKPYVFIVSYSLR